MVDDPEIQTIYEKQPAIYHYNSVLATSDITDAIEPLTNKISTCWWITSIQGSVNKEYRFFFLSFILRDKSVKMIITKSTLI